MSIMDIYRVALFGHRDFDAHEELEQKLFPILKQLIQEKDYVEFYIGRDGEFDVFTASLIKRFQRNTENTNSEMILVLPYVKKDVEFYEKYYDSVIIPSCMKGVHPKGAITKRNRRMIEQCDLLICYVKHQNGGSHDALKYAQKLKKHIINLATDFI